MCQKRIYEETNIKEDNHLILRNLYSVDENYIGTNKLNYRDTFITYQLLIQT